MSDPDRPPLVLVVCTANVCRSPLAALLLADGLARVEALGRIEVLSGGLRARAGESMCAVASSQLPGSLQVPALGHRSHGFVQEDVERAGLVLTMEIEQRSAMVQLLPGSQSKVFTLREVAALLAVVPTGAVRLDGLPALAAAAHGSRGLLAPPRPPQRRWLRRAAEAPHPLTIVDGHGQAGPVHLGAVRGVAEASQRLVAEARRLAAG